MTDQLKMMRHGSEPPGGGAASAFTRNQSPKRLPREGRPRSGCSESSFNMDTPRTPHFEQGVNTGSTTSSIADHSQLNGQLKNGAASFSNSFSSPSQFTFPDAFNPAIEQDCCLFTEPPNKKLCCPVCSNVFNEPVITTCGHTFCKACVKKSVDEICPIDNKPSKYIVDNIALSEQVGELSVHCKFGCMRDGNTGELVVNAKGCPAVVRLSEKLQHEAGCQFAPMSCPNNPNCHKFPKKDLEAHLATCNSVVCPHHKYGCTFVDTKERLDEHVTNCEFNNTAKEKLLDTIRQENNSAREDINFLFSSLQGLNQRCEQLERSNERDAEKDRGELLSHIDSLNVALDEVHAELAAARKERQMMMEEMEQLKQWQYQPTHHSTIDPEIIIKCKGTCVGHSGPVWCLAVNSEYLFSGSSDTHVKVWDISSNYRCVKTLGGHTGIVLALTVYGNRLYSGSQDNKIIVWNIDKDFDLETTLEAHDNPVCTLAASRSMIFSGSLKTVKVWSADSGKHIMKKEITGFNHWVRALYVTDKELYCGSYQTIEIYNLDTLEVTTTLKTYGGSVYSICVTDKHILCGTYEKVIHVWEQATMEQVTTLLGHNGTVYALTWMSTPNGILVFSASYDRTIRVWSQTNLICKQTLMRHGGSVACLAVSKGRLFSGGIDSMVKVWQ